MEHSRIPRVDASSVDPRQFGRGFQSPALPMPGMDLPSVAGLIAQGIVHLRRGEYTAGTEIITTAQQRLLSLAGEPDPELDAKFSEGDLLAEDLGTWAAMVAIYAPELGDDLRGAVLRVREMQAKAAEQDVTL